jgi:hypothetical protein
VECAAEAPAADRPTLKAALYGKWGNKERLIVAALTAWRTSQPPYVKSGSLRCDLAELAARILNTPSSSYCRPGVPSVPRNAWHTAVVAGPFMKT